MLPLNNNKIINKKHNYNNMTKTKIALINPGTGEIHGSGHSGCFYHRGLLQIATEVKNYFGDSIDIKILDGSVISTIEIKERLKTFEPDIVGISTLTFNYPNALKIAEYVKQNSKKNVEVILGNDHATYLGKTILKNRPNIDYICRGDHGAITFREFLKAHNGIIPISYVPNLMYRDIDGKIIENVSSGWSIDKSKNSLFVSQELDELPYPDLDLYSKEDMQKIINNFQKTYGKYFGMDAIPAVTAIAEGCSHGQESRCAYCNMCDLNLRTRSAEKINEEFKYLESKGCNIFYDVADCATSPSILLKRLEGFNNSGHKMLIYARAADITEEKIKLFRNLNIIQCNIGLDTSSDQGLHTLNKGNTTRKTNDNAIRFLKENNIFAYCSLVVGIRGETKESLNETVQYAKELLQYKNMIAIDSSSMLVLPGSPEFNYAIKNSEFNSLFDNKDIIDTKAVVETYIRNFCKGITYSDVYSAIQEIREMNDDKIIGGYGVAGE